MRILFFGTPEFAAASLELIAQEGFNVVAVVTAPDKPAGRGRQLKSSDVKVSAEKLNIPVFQPFLFLQKNPQKRLKIKGFRCLSLKTFFYCTKIISLIDRINHTAEVA